MEMESGGEDVTFQQQPIAGDGPGQESAVGYGTDGKNKICSPRKCQYQTFRTHFHSVTFVIIYKLKKK